ncbi:hypothetical protein B0H14DRAFT_3903026, partial [Mycena olivaceomarginata]
MRIHTMSVSSHGHRHSLPPRHTHLHRLRVVAMAWSALKSAYASSTMPLTATGRISEGLSRTDLSRTRAPVTVKQRRRSAGNWAPAAMRFTRAALVICGSQHSRPPPLRRSDGPLH